MFDQPPRQAAQQDNSTAPTKRVCRPRASATFQTTVGTAVMKQIVVGTFSVISSRPVLYTHLHITFALYLPLFCPSLSVLYLEQ